MAVERARLNEAEILDGSNGHQVPADFRRYRDLKDLNRFPVPLVNGSKPYLIVDSYIDLDAELIRQGLSIGSRPTEPEDYISYDDLLARTRQLWHSSSRPDQEQEGILRDNGFGLFKVERGTYIDVVGDNKDFFRRDEYELANMNPGLRESITPKMWVAVNLGDPFLGASFNATMGDQMRKVAAHSRTDIQPHFPNSNVEAVMLPAAAIAQVIIQHLVNSRNRVTNGKDSFRGSGRALGDCLHESAPVLSLSEELSLGSGLWLPSYRNYKIGTMSAVLFSSREN